MSSLEIVSSLNILKISFLQNKYKKGVAHILFKKNRIPNNGGTFDHGESESGVGLVQNRFYCSWTAKTGFWPKSGFWAYLTPKTHHHAKNLCIDAIVCVDSESAFRKSVGYRNREISFKNMRVFLLTADSFFLRRKERYVKTDFRYGIYTYKRSRKRLVLNFEGRIS